MPATDAVIARLSSELEERRAFQEQLAGAADEDGRDLNPHEMDLYTRATTRMAELEGQLAPLREGAALAVQSRSRTAELMSTLTQARTGDRRGEATGSVEYRSAGAYIADLYWARQGEAGAQQRLEVYTRAAAHQTTADNPGLLPETIVEPVIQFVDASRPLVTAIGPRDLGTGAWSYARVTQHTLVGPQAGEKTELPSRKMTITKTPLTAPTLGGYVNVSKQDIARTQPGILDMVINDLASQYAIETEEAAGTVLNTGATGGPIIPVGADAAAVAAALWEAAGAAYAGVKGAGGLILAVSPDMLGMIGPLFAPINPSNGYGTGFTAGSFGQGAMGAVSGITAVMSVGLPPNTVLVISTAAVRCFENRYGAMQVDEPSVWGVQVGYAGDFQTIIIEPAGVQKIGFTP